MCVLSLKELSSRVLHFLNNLRDHLEQCPTMSIKNVYSVAPSDSCHPQRQLFNSFVFFWLQYLNILLVDFHDINIANVSFLIIHVPSSYSYEVRKLYPNKFVQADNSRYFILNTLFNLPGILCNVIFSRLYL